MMSHITLITLAIVLWKYLPIYANFLGRKFFIYVRHRNSPCRVSGARGRIKKGNYKKTRVFSFEVQHAHRRFPSRFIAKCSSLIGWNKRDHLIGQNSMSMCDIWPIKWPCLYWPIREHFSAQLRNWSCYEWHFLIITWWIQFPKFGPNI